jgi:hypothetical protein
MHISEKPVAKSSYLSADSHSITEKAQTHKPLVENSQKAQVS